MGALVRCICRHLCRHSSRVCPNDLLCRPSVRLSLFVEGRLMPAHLALFLAVVYLFACQWIVASYIKVFRPFSSSLLRSVMLPRYWYLCLFFAVFTYFGLTFYLDCFQKLFMGFVFVYYLLKVTCYESIKVYNERVDLN